MNKSHCRTEFPSVSLLVPQLQPEGCMGSRTGQGVRTARVQEKSPRFFLARPRGARCRGLSWRRAGPTCVWPPSKAPVFLLTCAPHGRDTRKQSTSHSLSHSQDARSWHTHTASTGFENPCDPCHPQKVGPKAGSEPGFLPIKTTTLQKW